MLCRVYQADEIMFSARSTEITVTFPRVSYRTVAGGGGGALYARGVPTNTYNTVPSTYRHHCSSPGSQVAARTLR
jgi:hypothetical protein